MKKLLLVSLISLSSSLFAGADIGLSIRTPIGENSTLDLNFRSDDHRYDDRYRNFDYKRYGYYDNYGYYFGYFDRTGYFYNNIFFLYDGRYTYHDRLFLRGYFKPSHPHYREYRFHKNNDWNRSRNYRNDREPVYGPYYERNYNPNYKQKDDHKKHYDKKPSKYDYEDNRNSHQRDGHPHR